MRIFVALSDQGWFRQLAADPPDEVNFWQPSGARAFQALSAGELFPFKLHAPQDFVVGGGVFSHASNVPLSLAWDAFGAKGRRVWYDDQRRVQSQIHAGEELVDYAFMGIDPNAADNLWLREAMTAQVPVIYLLGIAPGRYTAVYPTFVVDWSATELTARLAFSVPVTRGTLPAPPTAPERRYALRLVSQRLHQATFREAVLAAYGSRCAVSGLPEPRLLDAAHIIADAHEELG